MEKNKVILVRSERKLIESAYVGYGWKNVNFSLHSTVELLLKDGFNGVNIGRKRKQITMFYNLKKDDIVIVPVGGAVAIGIVDGEKTYHQNSDIKNSYNRIKVNFFKNSKNQVLYVPRNQLNTDLERRLKIRMSIANLEHWNETIKTIIIGLKEGEIPTWDSAMLVKEEKAKSEFIHQLEERLRTEKGLGISAGGYGLEKIINEMFQAKGYDSEIPSKNSRPKGEDVDIIARKSDEFGELGEIYLIQVKHHRGTTPRIGLDQLKKCNDSENDENNIYKKVLITTAIVSDTLKEEAKRENITIVEGLELAQWIYDNLELLSSVTKRSIGIGEIPILL